MQVTRIKQAPHYQAANHTDMRLLRLQGHEASATSQLWMGMSQVLPGGGTALDGSMVEKHYVVLEGELTLVSELDGVVTEAVLGPYDSVSYAPGEKRQIINRSNQVGVILLAMPYPPLTLPSNPTK